MLLCMIIIQEIIVKVNSYDKRNCNEDIERVA